MGYNKLLSYSVIRVTKVYDDVFIKNKDVRYDWFFDDVVEGDSFYTSINLFDYGLGLFRIFVINSRTKTSIEIPLNIFNERVSIMYEFSYDCLTPSIDLLDRSGIKDYKQSLIDKLKKRNEQILNNQNLGSKQE
jgi:hypothetical protein